VAEGTTENTAVCTRLVSDLAERGLDATKGVLFVVDGGKALDKAIRMVFGPKARSSSGVVSIACPEGTPGPSGRR
jgi:transposase-like protein